MMDPRHDHNGYQLPPQQMGAPPMMNAPPPQVFYSAADGLPIMNNMPDMSQQQYMGDGGLHDDAGLMDESMEAKRRRIARVGGLRCGEGGADGYRLAICVGRRRSSAMERCLLVRIALIIRRNACLRRWRRRGILLKGLWHHGFCERHD